MYYQIVLRTEQGVTRIRVGYESEEDANNALKALTHIYPEGLEVRPM